MKSKNIIFLHKTMEKPYENLHFKFHDFLSKKQRRYEDFNFGFLFFPKINQFSLISL